MNETIRKFGYPETLVADYRHWLVLLRPQQATLGALVLAAKSEATAFAALPPESFAELAQIVPDIEATLRGAFAFEKINYLMLMMVDRQVHFHVLPRYGSARRFADIDFADSGWPRPPDLAQAPTLSASQLSQIRDHLKMLWPKRQSQ